MKTLIIFFFILPFTINAQDTPEQIINGFFLKYEQDSLSTAIDYIFSVNRIANITTAQIESLKIQLIGTHEALGKLYGKKLMVTKNIDDTLILYSYLVKYNVQPIRFNFIFYKPDQQWRLQTFWYEDNLISELKKANDINRPVTQESK